MSENKVFEVTLSNYASAFLRVIAPDAEEAKRIALENAPENGAFDQFEFSDEWEVDSVKPIDDEPFTGLVWDLMGM